MDALPRCTPEAVGIPSGAVESFVLASEERVGGLHSLLLLRHGQVAAEAWWAPSRANRPHMLYSLSKSFASTAVGLAVAEGRLTVDDPVLSFFPQEAPQAASPHLQAMRVRHLLSMTTGHDADTLGRMADAPDGNWARAFLALPVVYEPGCHFFYNTGATYMLSAIVQRLSGQTLVEYLTPRLFAPLGIEGAAWETCPQGINTGGFGLSVRTEDIARFGQLYLQGGVWQGSRLLPAEWVAEATAVHADNSSQSNIDWRQGYGYQFWRARHGAYRGDGAFGQFCLVMPAQDAVLAITSGVRDMQAVLDLVWEHLLPAMGPEPLAPAPDAQARLAEVLANRRVAPMDSVANLVPECEPDGCYVLDDNPTGLRSLTVAITRDRATIHLEGDGGVTAFTCAPGAWQDGQVSLAPRAEVPPRWQGLPGGPIAASGAWIDGSTYGTRLCYYETPFVFDVDYRFGEDRVTLHVSANASFGPTEWRPIVGRKA